MSLPNRRTALAVSSLSVFGLLAGCSSSTTTSGSHTSTSMPTSPVRQPSKGVVNTAIGSPVKLTVPSIKVEHTIDPLDVASDGTLTPAPHTVGWYIKTPTPGEVGNAVILAHVTYNGPDVFVNLKNMKKGDEAIITTSTGKKLTFKAITDPESIDKDKLETDQRVWGKSKDKMLVLASCDSSSPMVSAEHHKNNLVVWLKEV